VAFGPVVVQAGVGGAVSFRPVDHEPLQCHLGLLPVAVDGVGVGEIDIVPEKVTAEAFARLRADLEATWLGIVLDPTAPTALRARGPDVRTIWRELVPLVDAILREPRSEVTTVPGALRLERVRRASNLTPAVVMAAARGTAAPSRVVGTAPVAADHALVADTLQRLAAAARRQPGSDDILAGCRLLLTDPLFAGRVLAHGISHGARHDPRYRQVAALRRRLVTHDAVVTEGPGELRLGVKAIDRLYEYWVFLKIIEGLAARLGRPDPDDVRQLATHVGAGRVRLELVAGTVVGFADGTEAVFTPTISANPRESWHGLEHVPHPDPRYAQQFITPDTVVWFPGSQPAVTIVDAKYRARHTIDGVAAETHARYGRVRLGGERAVREVVVAHPHPGLVLDWPGYRAVPFVPGDTVALDLT
jgi:hypothetical protein